MLFETVANPCVRSRDYWKRNRIGKRSADYLINISPILQRLAASFLAHLIVAHKYGTGRVLLIFYYFTFVVGAMLNRYTFRHH